MTSENPLSKINHTLYSSLKEETSFDSSTSLSLPKHALDQREIDVIRMKANILLCKHPFFTGSRDETYSLIKKAPIHIEINPSTKTSTLCLTLTPFPGTSFKIVGSFQQSSDTLKTTPISNSFKLTYHSLSTGFPHPSQHTGWALCEPLLPYNVEIEKRKIALSNNLLSNTEYEKKTELLVKRKKELFNIHSVELLDLLHKLMSSIAKTCGGIEKDFSSIDHFFSLLNASFYDLLSEIHHFINIEFFIKPYALMQEQWIKEQTLLNFSNEVIKTVSSLETKAQNTQDSFEKAALKYITTIGKLLSKPCHQIMISNFCIFHHINSRPLNKKELLFIKLLETQLNIFLNQMEKPVADLQNENLLLLWKENILEEIQLLSSF